MRSAWFLLVVGLLAGACAASSSNDAQFGSAVTAGEDGSQTDLVEGRTASAEGAASASGESASGPESAELPDHFFPDIDVVDVGTGEPINVAAELAGGDRPVLLWFWAPH